MEIENEITIIFLIVFINSGGPMKNMIFISTVSDVKFDRDPITGYEKRLKFLGKTFNEYFRLLIITPSDVCDKEDVGNNVEKKSFPAFSLIKIKNMRLGTLLLDVNPIFAFQMLNHIYRRKPDVIIFSFPWGINLIYFLMKIFKKETLLIYNSHNVESEYSKIIMNDKSINHLLRRAYAKYIFALERGAVNKCDYVFSVSTENNKTFINLYDVGPEKIIDIPSGAVIPRNKQDSKREDNMIRIFFHGTYSATHNREAIDLIKGRIAKRFSGSGNVKFVVAGKGVPEEEDGNFLSLGFINDIFGYLFRCDIAIVPLENGEGTKLKIFDYMAAGLPIVITKKGAEGIDFTHEKNAFVTEHVDDNFMKYIDLLVNDKNLRRKIGEKGEQLLNDKYHPDKVKNNLFDFFDKVLN